MILYRYGYDAEENPPADCPQALNTMGRVRHRDDSFGRTWYQYDEDGRVVGEIRARAGATTCGALVNGPHTTYAYTVNGQLAQVVYPHGRTVTYEYGTGANADRVEAVEVTVYDGSVWTTTPVITKVTWEPYGGLRGYQIQHSPAATSGVEYFLGDNASVALQSPCSSTPPSAASSDYTGRQRALRVSRGDFSLGAGTGDILKRVYTWTAEQISQVDSCYLGAQVPRTFRYTYDRAKRLTQAVGANGGIHFGGTYAARSYTLGERDLRTAQMEETSRFALGFAAGALKDQLTSRSLAGEAPLVEEYSYDADGRVQSKRAIRVRPEEAVRSWLEFGYGSGAEAATDTVFKSVTVNGLSYNYYYDALGRRRAKVYPTGVRDEFFYNLENRLLTDQGASGVVPPVSYWVEDDYVWLDGRMVAIVRGRFNSSWSRASDSTADCARNGEAAACGVYFPITDYLTKPVLMLDGSGRIASLVEEDPFGHVNRVSTVAGTAHPYDNAKNTTLAYMRQPAGNWLGERQFPGTRVQMRALFGLIDTEMNGGLGKDYVQLVDANTELARMSGHEQRMVWSPWVTPANGEAWVMFVSDSQNCCPNPDGTLSCTADTCAQYPNYPYVGATVLGYEYKRYQVGATPFWTPVRFPGQYFDAETDLFENWNRYYDPSIGRYLQPEPLLSQTPKTWLFPEQGMTVPNAYAYAGNNPLASWDEDGMLQRQGCKNCPHEMKCREYANRIVGNLDLKNCVLRQCGKNSDEGAKLDCKKKTKEKECKKGKRSETGGASALGTPDTPVEEITWCELGKSEDCSAQILVHELAHSCGWDHGKGSGVPGDNGMINCK